MQPYCQQVHCLREQLHCLCGKGLEPQAFAPNIYPAGSGAVVCQLVPGSSSNADGGGTGSISKPVESTDVNTAAATTAAPEITQLLSTNRGLLVTFLNGTWQERQLQRWRQQQEQQAAGRQYGPHLNQPAVWPRDGSLAAAQGSIYASRSDLNNNNSGTGSSKSAGGNSTSSKWLHPELQQYLCELERGPWAQPSATASTAAAAVVAAQQPQDCMRHGCQDSPHQQHGTAIHQCAYSSSDGSGSLMSWLTAAYPAAAVAADGVLFNQRLQLQQEQQQNEAGTQASSKDGSSNNSSSLPEGARTMTEKAVTVKDHLLSLQDQPGLTIHPNIQPVHLLAVHSDSGTGSKGQHRHNSTGSDSSNNNCGTKCCCLVTAHQHTNVGSLLRHNPGCLGGDWHLRFLLHQLLHALAALHSRGLALGGLGMEQLVLLNPGWLQLLANPAGDLIWQQQQQQQQQPSIAAEAGPTAVGTTVSAVACSKQQQPQPQQQQRQEVYVISEPYYTLPQLTELWRARVISNFEYLMWVNAAAGRRWGDRKRHPYLPWVIDFSQKPLLNSDGTLGGICGSNSSSTGSSLVGPPPGWCDLAISQYRRIKGDAQLDQTYAMSTAAATAAAADGAAVAGTITVNTDSWAWTDWYSNSSGSSLDPASSGSPAAAVPAPHHISNEPMSELSYAIYMARRLPVMLLILLVRRSFRPEEYPCSIEALHRSSPDEALPQFYTDPNAFKSLHDCMPHLAVPAWANNAEEFVAIHRAALESEYVSQNLHCWLDLSFGVALSGPAGLAAKNIHLGAAAAGSAQQSSSGHGSPADYQGLVTSGVCQLFSRPHPQRCCRTSSSSSWSPVSCSHSSIQSAPCSLHNIMLADHATAVRENGAGTVAQDEIGYNSYDPNFSNPRPQLPPPPSPAELASCLSELFSLEAAAAVGSWQPSEVITAAAPAANCSIQGHWEQQQQQQHLPWQIQQQWQQQHQATYEQLRMPGIAAHSLAGTAAVHVPLGDCNSPIKLLPAFAADLAAVGQIALQLYQGQLQQQQQVVLGRGVGIYTAQQNVQASSSSGSNSSSSSGSNSSSSSGTRPFTSLGKGLSIMNPHVPSAAALFAQQCSTGVLSAQGLLNSSFFPAWMDTARDFLLKLLFAQQCAHKQAAVQQGCCEPVAGKVGCGDAAIEESAAEAAVCNRSSNDNGPCTSNDSAKHGGGSNSSSESVSDADSLWQQCDAFQSLVQLAAAGGLQQLSSTPEALQLCLPMILHIIRARLLHGASAAAADANEDLSSCNNNKQQRHPHVSQSLQQQRLKHFSLGFDACIIILHLTGVLSPLQVQQQLVPLLCDLLTAADHSSNDKASAFSPPTNSTQQNNSNCCLSNSQQVDYESECIRACRRAMLQPAVWQLLVTKLPLQQLLVRLLPLLLAAVLEPQQDGWQASSIDLTICAALPVGAAASLSHASNDTAVSSRTSKSAVSIGSSQQRGILALIPGQTAARGINTMEEGPRIQQRQQQQQQGSQVELAATCIAALAELLPFPVVCQHLLRPLLVALPWAGSGGSHCTAFGRRSSSRSSNASVEGSEGDDVACNGAGMALLAIGQVLPPHLAVEFVFKPVLQVALLPVQAAVAAGVSLPALSRGADVADALWDSVAGVASIGCHTRCTLPVIKELLLQLLPHMPPGLLLPSLLALVGDTAAAGASGGSTSSSVGTSSSATTGAAGPAFAIGSLAVSPSGFPAPVGAITAVPPASSTSNVAVAASTPAVLAGSQQATAVRFDQLADLLLLPPDVKAVRQWPLLYPRIAALLLQGVDHVSNSSSNLNASTDSSTACTLADITNIYRYWLLPQVLLPLLRLEVAHLWVQHGPVLRRCYWRIVLLLYAASVWHLGLQAVRDSTQAWHSTEVWLFAETGWQPQQSGTSTPAAGASASRVPHGRGGQHYANWLHMLAEQDRQAATAQDDSTGSQTNVDSAVRHNNSGTMAADPEHMTSTGVVADSTTSSAIADEATEADGSHSNSLSGRVSNLLQQLAEEKVVRRNLNTTNQFLQGVGWSRPRVGSITAGQVSESPSAAKATINGSTQPAPSPAAAAVIAAAIVNDSVSAVDATNKQHSLSLLQLQQSSPGLVANTFPGSVREGAKAPYGEPGDTLKRSSSAPQVMAAAAAAAVGAQATLQTTAAATPVKAMTAAAVAGTADTAVSSTGQCGANQHTAGGAASSAGRSRWAAELSELRSLLDSPIKPPAADRGPSAGKEWYWLLNNPSLQLTHLLPNLNDITAGSSSSASSRPWRSMAGVWWDEGWSLGAVALTTWPAHRDRMRAMAVDPGEHWVATAGRAGIRDAAGSHPGPVVRVWELADGEAKVQYGCHTAAVHKLLFLGPGSSAVASLDVAGAIHVWSRATGIQLTCFIPQEDVEPPLLASARVPLASSTSSRHSTQVDALGQLSPTAASAASAAGLTAAASSAAINTTSGFSSRAATGGYSLAAAVPDKQVDAALTTNMAVTGYGDFLERGCSSGRGWQALTPLPTSRQLEVTAANAAGFISRQGDVSPKTGLDGAPDAAAAAAPLALGRHFGYTCIASIAGTTASGGLHRPGCMYNAGSQLVGFLLAGTADGHVCSLDIESGALLDDMVACWEPRALVNPYTAAAQQLTVQQQLQHQGQLSLNRSTVGVYSGWEDPSTAVVTAVCHSANSGRGGLGGLAGWIAAGSGSGRVVLLDARAGRVMTTWQAHSQRVNNLQGFGHSQLLSCSQDKTLKLWDLRMLQQPGYWTAAVSSSSSSTASSLAVYKGGKSGIEGFAVYQDAAIVYGGANIGLAPLDSSCTSSNNSSSSKAPAATIVHQIRMTGVRNAIKGSAAGLRQAREASALGPKASGSAAIVGLGVLPHSKLLVVGSEDGQLRVCR